jgi:ribosomal protein S27AE
MEAVVKCAKCGSADLHAGTVDAFQPIVFRPTGPNEFLPRSVTVLARLCATCGDISLQADAESLRAFHTKP